MALQIFHVVQSAHLVVAIKISHVMAIISMGLHIVYHPFKLVESVEEMVCLFSNVNQ